MLLRLSLPTPARFETARQLDVQIGGAEANVAAVVARLGLRVAWISALPANEWGARVRRELVGHGIDCSAVPAIESSRMGLYFLEYGVPPRPIRVLYDRRDSAFTRLRTEDVNWQLVRHARIVHLSGITPALGALPRQLVERAVTEAAELSFDVNYRATLWSPAEARAFAESVLPRVRYLFIGMEEARTVFELGGAPDEVLEVLARRAPKAIIALMQGAEGCTVREGGRLLRPRRRHQVEVVDPIGAGDAFVGGFLWALLSGRTLEDAIEAAQAVAALKCSTWGDIALVTSRDVDDVLSGGPSVRR